MRRRPPAPEPTICLWALREGLAVEVDYARRPWVKIAADDWNNAVVREDGELQVWDPSDEEGVDPWRAVTSSDLLEETRASTSSRSPRPRRGR